MGLSFLFFSRCTKFIFKKIKDFFDLLEVDNYGVRLFNQKFRKSIMSVSIEDVGRGYLSDRLLVGLILIAVAFLVVYFFMLPWLPATWQTPGSLPLYVLGVIGTALLLVSMVFVWVKRTGYGGSPSAWFMAHVVTAILGMVLVAVHSAGTLTRAPALMFIALIGLSLVGVWARVRVSNQMSATFGSRYQNFGDMDVNRRAQLQQIISRKQGLLLRLDPTAVEGTFSLQLIHWYRKPVLAWLYSSLGRKEIRCIVGVSRALPLVQVYWRWVHIVLALVFLIGLVSHVFTVTFLAEYVAEGREITWPHLSW